MRVNIRKVSELAEQIRGVSYSKADASTEFRPGMLPVLRAGNIEDYGLTFDNLVYVPERMIKNWQMIRENDIVIAASSGSLDVVGKAAKAFTDFKGGFGAFCKVLRPRPSSDICPSYFAHYFKTQEYRRKVSSLAAGANINNLRNRDLDDLYIPVPPLKEQKHIAKILDEADALRTKRRESLAQLDALLQSTFLHIFGDPATNPMEWKTVIIGDAGAVQGGLQVTSKRRSLPIERPYLRVANVYRGGLDLSEVKSIRLTESEERRTTLEEGDILIVEGHGNKEEIGRCARWDGSIARCVHQNHLIRLRCDQTKFVPLYVENYLNSHGGRRGLLGTSRTTSGLNTISVSKVKSTAIAQPPLDLQNHFATIAQSIEQQKAQQRAHLAELNTLFAALQARAFAGEL